MPYNNLKIWANQFKIINKQVSTIISGVILVTFSLLSSILFLIARKGWDNDGTMIFIQFISILLNTFATAAFATVISYNLFLGHKKNGIIDLEVESGVSTRFIFMSRLVTGIISIFAYTTLSFLLSFVAFANTYLTTNRLLQFVTIPALASYLLVILLFTIATLIYACIKKTQAIILCFFLLSLVAIMPIISSVLSTVSKDRQNKDNSVIVLSTMFGTQANEILKKTKLLEKRNDLKTKINSNITNIFNGSDELFEFNYSDFDQFRTAYNYNSMEDGYYLFTTDNKSSDKTTYDLLEGTSIGEFMKNIYKKTFALYTDDNDREGLSKALLSHFGNSESGGTVTISNEYQNLSQVDSTDWISNLIPQKIDYDNYINQLCQSTNDEILINMLKELRNIYFDYKDFNNDSIKLNNKGDTRLFPLKRSSELQLSFNHPYYENENKSDKNNLTIIPFLDEGSDKPKLPVLSKDQIDETTKETLEYMLHPELAITNSIIWNLVRASYSGYLKEFIETRGTSYDLFIKKSKMESYLNIFGYLTQISAMGTQKNLRDLFKEQDGILYIPLDRYISAKYFNKIKNNFANLDIDGGEKSNFEDIKPTELLTNHSNYFAGFMILLISIGITIGSYYAFKKTLRK